MTQPTPTPDASPGLADSDDLFAFDEVAAAAAPTKRAPIDPDALIEAFDEQRGATQTSDAQAAVADAVASSPAPRAQPAAAPEVAAPEIAATVAAAPLVARRPSRVRAALIAAFLLVNTSVLWIALRGSSRSEQQLSELTASVLELARAAQPPAASVPQAPVHEAPTQAPIAEKPVVERAPALPDYDSDPRREREFASIEALLEEGQPDAARRQIYALLARADLLAGTTRDAVETRAVYLLARSLRDQASTLPPHAGAAEAPHAEEDR